MRIRGTAELNKVGQASMQFACRCLASAIRIQDLARFNTVTTS